MRRLIFLVLTLIMTASVITGLFEAYGRRRYASDIRVIRDPDHRMAANTEENNSDGIRCRFEASHFSQEDLNIIFLGDSFTYGYKTYPHLAFPQQFETIIHETWPQLNVNVANFGWTSSSPYLSNRLLRDIGKKYNPDVVALYVDMTDFYDDIRYKNFIERPTWVYRVLPHLPGITSLVKKNLTRLAGRSDGINDRFEALFNIPATRHFASHQPMAASMKHAETILASIREIARYTQEELGARFLVVIYPRSYQYSEREAPTNWAKNSYEIMGEYSLEPFAIFEAFARSESFPVHSFLRTFQETDVFPTCRYEDPHWTERGNRLVAETTVELFRAEGILPAIGPRAP